MAYTLYDATITQAKGALTSLQNILREGETHADAATFPQARLIDDMQPLTFQVFEVTLHAQLMASRFMPEKQKDFIEPKDDLDSYESMHLRIQLTLDMLHATDKQKVNELGDTIVPYTIRTEVKQVPIKALAGQLHMPSVYFHMSMVYAILRKQGVPLGKRYYMRGFIGEYVAA